MERPRTIRRDDALWLLERMRLVRQTSERIALLYPTNVMETPVHLCIGQEAVSVGLRYVDNTGAVTQTYPFNPNGSPQGIASVTNDDGRFTVLMPHAERVFRSVQQSWHPSSWGEDSPWMRMFRNARKFVG